MLNLRSAQKQITNGTTTYEVIMDDFKTFRINEDQWQELTNGALDEAFN